MSDDPFRDWDSAYVLGMLEPQERRDFEDHLATCESCSTAVAELAGMPGILNTLSTAEAVALVDAVEHDVRSTVPEPDLVSRLAVAARARRRRARLAVAGAGLAAAAALAVGGYALGSAPDDTSAGSGFVAMSEVEPGSVNADIRVEEKKWGTRFDWSCHYQDVDTRYSGSSSYELVVVDRAGKETVAATWTAASPRTSSLVASSSIPTSEIRAVEIRRAGTRATLTRTRL
jgi:anti-sigma factor RsiW